MPGPAPSEYSPFSRCGMPQANSTTSRPRWMSPLESAKVLPCSDGQQPRQIVVLALDQLQELEHDAGAALRIGGGPGRERRLAALAIACSTSDLAASATLACTSPVLGLKTSPKRPDAPLTSLPPIKCPISRIAILPGRNGAAAASRPILLLFSMAVIPAFGVHPWRAYATALK